ncbi:hypothetical protein D8X55_01240 [Malacoplasma penetrans]|uniref:Uncharacterized protein n=1 Tax=Malacoplasma penetrans (strain HF-2) TaxID=272633 RepID=Q8EUP0_MALP2|nr:hypothetical protein [Malacoplasma penetrans]RXY97085.1 hypothetical protein D8X55_01240 [Malacoplasma penetrans]BAC44672.1 hypothetical protein [Malacoplasma penetrans HF-2]
MDKEIKKAIDDIMCFIIVKKGIEEKIAYGTDSSGQKTIYNPITKQWIPFRSYSNVLKDIKTDIVNLLYPSVGDKLELCESSRIFNDNLPEWREKYAENSINWIADSAGEIETLLLEAAAAKGNQYEPIREFIDSYKNKKN